MRSMGSLLYRSVDHLFEGGDLRRVPMPLGGNQQIFNPTGDMFMSKVNDQQHMSGFQSVIIRMSLIIVRPYRVRLLIVMVVDLPAMILKM